LADQLPNILSISVPQGLRAKLDAEARRQRRSRSFVVAEALEQYLGGRDHNTFDAARTRTLREGLALPPAERLRLSEELWQEFARGRPQRTAWSKSFETFDEYEEWRRESGR
jgi:predicted transcriptional regulator